MRIGLLGAGRIGQIHGRSAAEHKSATLAAVFDVDAKAAGAIAAGTGATVAKGIPDIIGDKSIDAVFIATPPYLHSEMAIAALRAGKSVYCEKPVGMTASTSRPLRTAATTRS